MNKIMWLRVEPHNYGTTVTIVRREHFDTFPYNRDKFREYELTDYSHDKFTRIIDLTDRWDVYPSYTEKCKIECIEYYRRNYD